MLCCHLLWHFICIVWQTSNMKWQALFFLKTNLIFLSNLRVNIHISLLLSFFSVATDYFLLQFCLAITKALLFKYIENFTTKKGKFSDENSNIFHISAQNIDCGYLLEPPQWGSSNKYPQSMFWAEIWKNNVYPCKPQFYYIKVEFKGVKII